METNVKIPLAEAIRAVRLELLTAIREGGDEELRFALGPVELEFRVDVSREAGGETGISFWVISLGGRGSKSSATAHTVKLSLTPVRAGAAGAVVVGSEELERPD